MSESLRPGRAFAVLAGLGFGVGPVLDGLHTWSGATWYGAPQFLKSVWWCPPLFCFAALAIGLGRLATERMINRPSPRPTPHTVAVSMSAFVLGYAASGFLPAPEATKAVLLFLAAVAVWWALDRTLPGVLGALAAGFGGWLVEHTLVGQGLFFHRDVALDGVALWIPPLYFLAAIAIGHVALISARAKAPGP
ncbi:MAG: hypothetical protein U0228_07605 [Myxococcaceae bacterium]